MEIVGKTKREREWIFPLGFYGKLRVAQAQQGGARDRGRVGGCDVRAGV